MNDFSDPSIRFDPSNEQLWQEESQEETANLKTFIDENARPLQPEDAGTDTVLYRPGLEGAPRDFFAPGGDGFDAGPGYSVELFPPGYRPFVPPGEGSPGDSDFIVIVDPNNPGSGDLSFPPDLERPPIGLFPPGYRPDLPVDPPPASTPPDGTVFEPDRLAPVGRVDGFVLQTDTERPGFDGGGSYTVISAGDDNINGGVARFDGASGADHLELQVRDPSTDTWVTLIPDTRTVQGEPEFILPTIPAGDTLDFRAINHTQGTEIHSDSGLVKIDDSGSGSLSVRFEDRQMEGGDFNDLELTVSRPGLTIQELAQQTGPDEGGDFERVITTEGHDHFGIKYAQSSTDDNLELQFKDPESGAWQTIVESTQSANWFERSDLGALPAGSELEFRLINRTTGGVFTSDSGMAKIDRNDDGSITYAFEARQSSDRDFDDLVFTVHRPGAAPLGRPTRPEIGTSFVTELNDPNTSDADKRAALEGFFAAHPNGGILAQDELDAVINFVQTSAPDLKQALLDNWLAPLPFTDEQIDAVDSAVQDAFLEQLSEAEDGTPEKTFYNLMKVISLSEQEPFQGKVDLDKVNADLAAMQADPEIRARFQGIQEELRAEQAAAQLGTGAVNELVDYITGPAFQDRLRLMPEDQQEAAVREAFTHLAKVAPSETFDQALLDFQAAGINHDPQDFLQTVPIDDVEAVTTDLLNEIFSKGQLGFAPTTYLADSLNHLDASQRAQLARGITEAARASGGELTPENLQLQLDRMNLAPELHSAGRNFVDALQERGAFDAFFAFAGAAALIYNASEGNLPQTTAGRLQTAAGAMAVISKGEATAKLVGATKLLGLDTSTAQNLKWVGEGLQQLGGNLADQANRLREIFQMDRADAVEALAQEGIEDSEAFFDAVEEEFFDAVDDPGALENGEEFFDALSEVEDEEAFFDAFETLEEVEAELGPPVDFARIGATAEAQAAESGTEAANDLARIASRVGEEAAEEAPSVLAKGLEMAGHTLKVLNWLGPIADGITAGLATKDAIDDFKEGDNIGGFLEVGEAASAATSALATAAFLAGTGVGAPIALAATAVGFALAIGDFFHHQAKQRHEIEGYENFIQEGVGNGENYWIGADYDPGDPFQNPSPFDPYDPFGPFYP